MATSEGSLSSAAYSLAAQQGGVVRRQQLLALGMSPRTLQRRIADGLWTPYGRAVLALAGTPGDLRTRSLVAAQMTWPNAVLTGCSAIVVRGLASEPPWDVLDLDDLPWLITAERVRFPAVAVRRKRVTATTELGVRVADQAAALVDLLRLLPLDSARRLCHRSAQVGGHQRLACLLAEAEPDLGGTWGLRQLRALASELSEGAHSEAERRVILLLPGAGIDDFVANFKVRVGSRLYEIDVAFPLQRVAIEVDGQAWHVSPRTFQSDRERQNALVASGWTVLRFTWADLEHRPEQVVAQIAAAIY